MRRATVSYFSPTPRTKCRNFSNFSPTHSLRARSTARAEEFSAGYGELSNLVEVLGRLWLHSPSVRSLRSRRWALVCNAFGVEASWNRQLRTAQFSARTPRAFHNKSHGRDQWKRTLGCSPPHAHDPDECPTSVYLLIPTRLTTAFTCGPAARNVMSRETVMPARQVQRPCSALRPHARSTAQHPRKCGPGPRQCSSNSSSQHPASSSASAKTGRAAKSLEA